MKLFLSFMILFVQVQAFSLEIITEPEKVFGIEPITNIQLSGDNSRMLSSGPSVVYVWDTNTWQVIQKYKPVHTETIGETIRSCSISENGELLFLLIEDNSAINASFSTKIYDINSNQIITSNEIDYLETDERIFGYDLIPLPDNQRYLLTLIREVYTSTSFINVPRTVLVDFTTGEVIREYDAIALAVSPDGKTFCSGTNSGYYKNSFLWDIDTGNIIKSIPNGMFDALFTSDGTKLLKKTNNFLLELIDIKSVESLLQFNSDVSIKQIFISSDSNKVGFFTGYNHINIYDLSSDSELQEIFFNTPFPISTSHTSMLFLDQGNHILSINAGGLSLYNTDTGQETKNLTEEINSYVSLNERYYHFIPSDDGNRIMMASTSQTGNLIVLDVNTGKDILNFVQPMGYKVFSSNLDKFFSYLNSWSETYVYKVASPPTLIKTIQTGGVFVADYSSEKDQLLVRDWNTGDINLWDVETGEMIKTIPTFSPSTYRAYFTRDGNQAIIHYMEDNNTYSYELIDLQTNSLINYISFKPQEPLWMESISLSNNKRYMLSENGNLFNLETGEQLFDLPANDMPSSLFVNNQFSSDDKYVAILPVDQIERPHLNNSNVRIYSTETGDEVYRLATSQYPVFAHDGMHLYTIGRNEPVKYWSLEPEQSHLSNWQCY